MGTDFFGYTQFKSALNRSKNLSKSPYSPLKHSNCAFCFSVLLSKALIA